MKSIEEYKYFETWVRGSAETFSRIGPMTPLTLSLLRTA